jgi:hypothetical protein
MAARAALNKALRHERSSVAGFGLPALFSAFVRMGGESDEGCDLFSGQAAELRQVGDQRRGHDGTHAAHPAQSLGEAIKLPIAGDVALDRLLDGVKALGQRRDDRGETLPDDRLARQIGAAAFRLAGVDKLPAPGGQRPQALVGGKRRGQIDAPCGVGGIVGDQHRID